MLRCRSGLQPYPIYTTVLTGKNIPPHLGYRPRIPHAVLEMLEKEKVQETPPETVKNKIIQTLFRDSVAQTDPYVVDIEEEKTDKGLEILTLSWLSWNNGLPAGMIEVNTIERARQKRVWESSLPIPFDKFGQEIRAIIVEAIEINEWNYREHLIEIIGSLRMELAEKQMKERMEENKAKYEKRLAQYIQMKKEEKNKKIYKLRSTFNREIRKLTFARQFNRKYHRSNIIQQFADKTSELYAPLMRFGVDPRNWHEKINPKFETTLSFQKLEIMHQTAEDIPDTPKMAFDYHKKSKPRGRATELCIRETKWTEQNLEGLYEQLRNIRRKRLISPKPLYLRKKVGVHEPEAETPCVEGIPDEEENFFRACLFLQKTVKGRAIQAVMFEGRVKYQELIEELKSTHALQHDMEDMKAEMRKRVYNLQREAEIEEMHKRRKNEILCSLEGKTTGDMLDFLAKELLRLQDERTTHALALAADQERHKREAAEAGRRQVEEQRRREHDEMFKQVVKVHQNTVQAFMEDVMVQNKNWLANRDARERVTEIAKKIDQTALEMADFRSEGLMEEKIIADLIHNFALPEVEKRIVRKRLQDKQMNYLRVCHDEVYLNIEKAVAGPRDEKGRLLPLPKVGKHKIPPLIRVKYLNLKRMHESSSSTLESGQSNVSVMDEKFMEHKKVQNAEKEVKEEQSPPPEKEMFSSGFSKEDVVLDN